MFQACDQQLFHNWPAGGSTGSEIQFNHVEWIMFFLFDIFTDLVLFNM